MDTKKIIRRAAVVFAACVLVMAFFSTTIHNYRLPIVTVNYVQSGAITTSLYGEGEAELLTEYPLYTEFAGTVVLHARENSVYEAGAPLYSITPDSVSISAELAAQTQTLALLDTRLTQNALDIAFNRTKLSAPLDNMSADALDLRAFDSQISGIERNLAAQQKALADTQALYTAGVATLAEVTAAENALIALEMQLSDTQAARQDAIAVHEKQAAQAVTDNAKQHAETIAALNRTISDLEFQRAEIEINRAAAAKKIEELNQIPLTAMDIYAPSDCVVTEVMAETGETVGKNQKLLRIGHINQDYEANLLFTSDLPSFTEDASLLLSVPSVGRNGIACDILRIMHNKDDMIVRVRFTAAGLIGGERVEARLENVSRKYEAILPNSAIAGTPGDYKVYAVETKPGVFGDEYYLREWSVERYEYNDSVSAVSLFMDLETTPYVINSDRAVRDGDRVRLANPSDYSGTR